MSADLGGRVAGYRAELVARLDAQLGERLVGVWLFGSAAVGDFDLRRTDLDAQAVSTVGMPVAERARLAARALARGTLVPGQRPGVRPVRAYLAREHGPSFQLNLNTGPRMTRHVGYAADDDPRFWFVLDVAIGREHARVRWPVPRQPRCSQCWLVG